MATDVKDALQTLVNSVDAAIDQWLLDLGNLGVDPPQNFPVYPAVPIALFKEWLQLTNEEIETMFSDIDTANQANVDAEEVRETDIIAQATNRKNAALQRKADLVALKGHGKPS